MARKVLFNKLILPPVGITWPKNAFNAVSLPFWQLT